ncbi:MAG: 2OG-Fe(II) oxygenase [Deltaproteobacteria bacterium CG11_big_fil_rev_8_21_14_0_20_45_16]|nr:MAG: 2OG-Fe(II) oxygenase [Deltaproteobacteria bacterium CG11_big_fil_rev_8_21_14_0_20_45_16]
MQVLKADFEGSDGAKIFVESCRSTGFAVVTNHPIKRGLVDAVYAEWKEFFASDSKFDYLFNKDTQAGYFPFKSENAKGYSQKDLKEFFHVYEGQPFPAQLSKKTFELRMQLFELGQSLLRWLDEGTPPEVREHYSMPLDQMALGSKKNLFRIIHYPPLTGVEDAGAVRAAAHEDINLITLLPASTAMGLQVKDLAGDWHDVLGNYGDVVVNVGDMLQMASQNYFRSTTHQVVNPKAEAARGSRFSMPLFIHPYPEVKLSAQHTAASYLDERLSEIGLK